MRKLILVILLYLLTLIQIGFCSHFKIDGVGLNIVLLAVLLIALSQKNYLVVWWSAFWGGLFLDLFYYRQLGLATLTLLVLIGLFYLWRRFFILKGMAGGLIYLTLFNLLYEPIRGGLSLVLGMTPINISLYSMAIQILCHLILVIGLRLILPTKLSRRFAI